jgi:hypothetical protein
MTTEVANAGCVAYRMLDELQPDTLVVTTEVGDEGGGRRGMREAAAQGRGRRRQTGRG